MNAPEVEGHGFDPCQDLLAFTQYHGNNHDDFQLMAEFHEQIGPNPVVSANELFYSVLSQSIQSRCQRFNQPSFVVTW